MLGTLTGGIIDSVYSNNQSSLPNGETYTNRKVVRNLPLTLAGVINDTTSAVDGIQMSLSSLPWAMVDNYIAPYFLFASHVVFVPLPIPLGLITQAW